MKCIHCGTENPDTSKFCNNCGAKLEPKQDNSRVSNDNHFKQFFERNKSWIIGYAVWAMVNITLLLFGGKGAYEGGYWGGQHWGDYITAKGLFFPFNGKAENYDFTEFFIYVIAVPVLAYAIYYFYNKFKTYITNKTNNS